MEGSGAHAASGLILRGSIWEACALNPAPAIRRSHRPRSNQTPGRPFIPHRRRQRRLQRLSRSGTRPSICLAGKGGTSEAMRCPCWRCQSIGQMAAVWPEHSGDSMTLSSHRKGTKPFAYPTRRLSALSQGTSVSLFSLCSARILWANHTATVIRAVGNAPSSIARRPSSSRQLG